MKLILAIGLGSFFGGVSRYLVSEFVKTFTSQNLPHATFVVNLVGCFLIGICFSLLEKNFLDKTWFAIIGIGFLGGFTTFSAFSLDTFKLLREQNYTVLVWYIFGSVVLGLLATILGYWIVKKGSLL
jgi:fluoride exporter